MADQDPAGNRTPTTDDTARPAPTRRVGFKSMMWIIVLMLVVAAVVLWAA